VSDPSVNEVDGRAGAVGWSLLLPPGWWHIPLDERRGQSVTALLDRQLASLPRDRVATLRREVEGELTQLVERAIANGAVEIYLNVDLIRGLPVAASCLVTVVPTGAATALPAAELAALMRERPGDEVGVLEVAGAPAARVRRREPVTDADGLSSGELAITPPAGVRAGAAHDRDAAAVFQHPDGPDRRRDGGAVRRDRRVAALAAGMSGSRVRAGLGALGRGRAVLGKRAMSG
jgi:hypothetical protein